MKVTNKEANYGNLRVRITTEDDTLGTTYVDFSKYNAYWHVVCYGRNFKTFKQAMEYLHNVKEHWHDEDEPTRETCHAEMTHAFLANEASLDACPY